VLQNSLSLILILCNSWPSISNHRAWKLLERIVEEKPWVQSHIPFSILSFVINASHQDTRTTVPSRVEEIEKEVHDFRQQLELDNRDKENRDIEIWTAEWKKWEGEWDARPIGVI
jgi:hypothetical protein